MVVGEGREPGREGVPRRLTRDYGREGAGGQADVRLQGAHRRGHGQDARSEQEDYLPAPGPCWLNASAFLQAQCPCYRK